MEKDVNFYEVIQKIKSTNKWVHKGYFRTYKHALSYFVHKNGLFRISECKFKS